MGAMEPTGIAAIMVNTRKAVGSGESGRNIIRATIGMTSCRNAMKA